MGLKALSIALAVAMAAGTLFPECRALAEGLQEIVVTAQKREQREQEVPITMSVITGETLLAGDTKDLLQLANYVPGMVFSRAPDDGLALSFRGVGTPARTQAFDQSVALFLDGLFLAKGRLYSQALFDVEQTEFTKGTQSTVLGKNASVGAISVVSREPGSALSGDLRATAELQHGGGTVDGALDIPVGDAAAVRLAAHHNDTSGWVRNTATGREVPIDRDTGVRLTGVWHPGDEFDAKLSYQHGQDLRIGVPYQIVDAHLPPAFGEGVFDDRESELTTYNKNRETTHDTRSDFVNLRMIWHLGGMNLVSQTGYVQYRLSFDDDFDFSNQPWIDFVRDERYTQESEEIRLVSSSDGRSEYLAGLFAFHNHWHSVERQLWDVPGFPPGTPIAGQLYNGPFTNDFSQTTNSQAAFGQWTWRWLDPLQSTVGLRATHESKDVLYGRANAAPLTIWNTVANPPFPLTPLSFDDTFVDGNASLQWHVSHTVMAYIAYGRGTKTGGFVETNSISSADPNKDARIGSETTNTVELGVKTLWQADAIKLNVSIFNMRVKDFQDTTFTGTAFITENLPLRSKGVDIDSEWQASRKLHLSAAVTYADATESPTESDRLAGILCNPCQATSAPRWNGSAQMNFRDSLSDGLDWTANLHVRHRGTMFNQRGEVSRTNSFTPIDVGVGVAAQNGRYGVDLLGKNIFNRLTEDFSSPSVAPYFAGLASPAPLRTVNVSVWRRFGT
jgi:iron complex outermembrane receptor protein